MAETGLAPMTQLTKSIGWIAISVIWSPESQQK